LGNNIFTNGLLMVTKGVVSNSSNYNLSVSDISPDRVSIEIKALNTGLGLYTINSIEEQLIHVQLTSSLAGNPDVHFDDANMQQLSEFLNTNNLPEAFQQVFAIGSIEDVGGSPTANTVNIFNFFPPILNAGTGDTLYIIGENFDTVRGSSSVEFTNSKNGRYPVDWIAPMESEYVSWSDTLIKVKVPGVDKNSDFSNSAGTGKFRVKINGQTKVSSSDIYIQFAAMNAGSGAFSTPPNTAFPMRIGNYNNRGGQSIYYENNFKSDSNAVKAFERALINWKCATFINYIVQEKDSIPNLNDAGKVEFDALPIGVITTFASTSNIPFPCIDSTTLSGYNRKRFTIKFNTGLSWHTSTAMPAALPPNTYDLESRAAHELGHAHLLNHSNNINDLMFFTDSVAPYNYRRDIMPNDLLGGEHIVTISEVQIIGCQNHMIRLNVGNCGSATNTKKHISDDINISVFPNPTSNQLYFQIKTSQSFVTNSDIKLVIFDLLGREIKNMRLNNLITSLDVLSYPAGVYIIVVFKDGEIIQSTKFKKL
jgi:hypothetical protein